MKNDLGLEFIERAFAAVSNDYPLSPEKVTFLDSCDAIDMYLDNIRKFESSGVFVDKVTDRQFASIIAEIAERIRDARNQNREVDTQTISALIVERVKEINKRVKEINK